jgi:hypothetical protein
VASAASSAYDFLKKDYKPAYYYFECVNLLEKLLVRAHNRFCGNRSHPY